MQQELIEVFSLNQNIAENEPLKLQHQKSIEAANQLLQKLELESVQPKLLHEVNQPNTGVQDCYTAMENIR